MEVKEKVDADMEINPKVLRKMLVEKYPGTANMTDPEEYEILKYLLKNVYKDGKVEPALAAVLYGILGGEKLQTVYMFAKLSLLVETYPQILERRLPDNVKEEDREGLRAILRLLEENEKLTSSLEEAIKKNWQEELRVEDPEVKKLLYIGRHYLVLLAYMDFNEEELSKIVRKMESPQKASKVSEREFFKNKEIIKAVSEYYVNKKGHSHEFMASALAPLLRMKEVEIDGEETEKLTGLVEKLKKRMGVQEDVQLRIIDLDEANAYVVYKGKDKHEIWLTRKFVEVFKGEKERAAIIAHELGHIKEKDALLDPEYVGKLAQYITTGEKIEGVHAACKMSRTREYRADLHAIRTVAEEYGMSFSDAMGLFYQAIKKMTELSPLSQKMKKKEECFYHDREIFAPRL